MIKNHVLWVFLFVGTVICAQSKPNVIIILADDQGWGDLSCNGNSNLKTPNIDQLSLEGATFSNFYVSAVCSPTRAELLTGRYHARTGVYSTSEGGERFNSDEVTLADILKKDGYATGVFGKWHNGMQAPYHPNSRGFDEFYGFASGHWGNYFSPMLEHNGEMVQGSGYLPDDLTDHAISFLNDHKDRSFFLYLPFNTPHSPMQVPDDFWNSQVQKPLEMYNMKREEEDTLFTKAALAMVENIDYNVGRLLSEVEKLDLSTNTIIIYLSDNGPNGVRWNGGMKGRKGSTDEGGVKSPLFIKWEGQIESGEVYSSITSVVDILPTILTLTGSNHISSKTLDGIDMFKPQEDRIIYSNWKKDCSLRSQRFRLDTDNRLFEVENDPGQENNVSKLFPS
jgi:arylsulfatase A-like enzyme